MFQVFSSLPVNQVSEWTSLSLDTVLQRTPYPLSTWILACLLIASADNVWLRYLYPLLPPLDLSGRGLGFGISD